MWLKISARHLISPLIQRGSKSHKDPYAGFLSLRLRRIRADRRQDWSRWDARFLQVIFTPVPPVLLSDIPDIGTGDYLMRLCLKIDRRTGGTGESTSLDNLRHGNHQRGGSLQLPQTARGLDASAPFLGAIQGSVKMKQNSIQAIKNLSAFSLRFFAEAASSRPVEDPSPTLLRISYRRGYILSRGR